MTRRRLFVVLVITVVGFATAPSFARQTTFRSAALSVEIGAAVTSGNRPVTGLTINDFELTDNGVPQKLVDVSREKLPVDVTFVIDVSGSVSGRLLESLAAGAKRVRDRLRPVDRMSVVTFSDRIRERMALAAPAKASSVPLGAAGGFTSLYDALAAALIAPPPVERRQMTILFTDGVDTVSFLNAETALEVARRSQTTVFFVLATYSLNAHPVAFFGNVAEATGGFVQAVTINASTVTVNGQPVQTDRSETVDGSFVRAFDDFLTSYVLRYSVEGVPQPGWHNVAIHVKQPAGSRPYTLRARPGYFGR